MCAIYHGMGTCVCLGVCVCVCRETLSVIRQGLQLAQASGGNKVWGRGTGWTWEQTLCVICEHHPSTHSHRGTKTHAPWTHWPMMAAGLRPQPHSHGRPTEAGTETAGGSLCLGPTARLLLSKANTATATTEHLPIASEATCRPLRRAILGAASSHFVGNSPLETAVMGLHRDHSHLGSGLPWLMH